MKNKKGFTLIELMVVVLIVGILAAAAVPMMSGRIDAAKWSEGRAGAGTLITGVRAYVAENGPGTYTFTKGESGGYPELGVSELDLKGSYFTAACYTVGTATYNNTGLACTVTVNSSSGTTDKPTTEPITRYLVVSKSEGEWKTSLD